MATYLILNFVVLVLLIGCCLAARLHPHKRWGIILVALLVMTALFDNVIVGLGIVAYDPTKISGIKLGNAPVEDFAYALGAALTIPLLWRKGARK